MHFTLQQLKLFESVFRNGSYTRAAEELHLSQPAVSIQIKRLEEQAGLPLFELMGKKIFPTEAGKTIYKASCDILKSIEEVKNTIESIKGDVKGPLRLSVVTTSKYFMPHLLGSFLNKYPDVEPKLVFTNRSKVIQRLQNNEDDFVVMGQIPEDDKLETYPFLENILVPVAHPNHPLAGKKNISLKQLAEHRFLVREEGSGTRLVFDRLLKKNELVIEPYMQLGSSEALKQAVMAGLGLAILSLHSLRLELAANKLVVLDVEGFPIKRRWFAVHLKGKQLSLVSRTFLDYILEQSKHILDFDFKDYNT
ncbi:MAG: LysR family transcriptional regulator [Gammaproteobacteria bacterium]|nr:LysR family transcriptional regulator [Gammaproteobacteria bacterium]